MQNKYKKSGFKPILEAVPSKIDYQAVTVRFVKVNNSLKQKRLLLTPTGPCRREEKRTKRLQRIDRPEYFNIACT